MWKKFKNWLINKFLPAWCRDELIGENKRLKTKIEQQAAEISRLNAYIAGMQDAAKRQPRIIIKGGEHSA